MLILKMLKIFLMILVTAPCTLIIPANFITRPSKIIDILYRVNSISK